MDGKTDFTGVITALPPWLQAVVVGVAAVVLALILWRKVVRQLVMDPPGPQELIVGNKATMADMQPILHLLQNVDLQTLQLTKNELMLSNFTAAVQELAKATGHSMTAIGRSNASVNKSLAQLIDITGEILLDFRTEREEQRDAEREAAAEARGFQRGLEQEPPKPKRRVVRRPKASN